MTLGVHGLARLIVQRPEHWTSEALCDGDDRFTKASYQLTESDLLELEDVCMSCPVYVRCAADAVRRTGVFQAAEWRGSQDVPDRED